MDGLREAITENSAVVLALGGLIVGLVFGFIVQRTNFCAMGSISDILTFGDYRRFRAWLLAAATALLGTQLLQALGMVDLERSMYLGASLNWLGNVLGGILFGIGMVFAGGCTSRNLVRAGGGDVRSLIVLMVVGLFAYMTIGGIIGPARAELQAMSQIDLSRFALDSQSMGDMLALVTGQESGLGSWIATLAIAAAILIYCFKDAGFRSSPIHLVAGFGIGLCIIAGWAVTGLAFDEFADQPQAPISLTYVRPAGDAFEYLRRFTAASMPDFAVTSVFGALLGAFLAAVSAGRFQLTSFADTGDTLRNLGGAMLMGIGGVMALGCTIGQAVTGLSTLALGSLLTFAAIVAGGIIGVKSLERILMA